VAIPPAVYRNSAILILHLHQLCRKVVTKLRLFMTQLNLIISFPFQRNLFDVFFYELPNSNFGLTPFVNDRWSVHLRPCFLWRGRVLVFRRSGPPEEKKSSKSITYLFSHSFRLERATPSIQINAPPNPNTMLVRTFHTPTPFRL
jgi:hypothetical protein